MEQCEGSTAQTTGLSAYPVGASSAAPSSQSNRESRRRLDWHASPRIDDNDVNNGGIVIADDNDGDCYPPPADTLLSLLYLDQSAATVAAAHRLAHPPHHNHNRNCNRHHNSPGAGGRGGGGACRAELPCPLRGGCHVPILIGRHITALILQQGGQICTISVVGLHPEGDNGSKRQVLLHPGGGVSLV
jgi:hypothetical protein